MKLCHQLIAFCRVPIHLPSPKFGPRDIDVGKPPCLMVHKREYYAEHGEFWQSLPELWIPFSRDHGMTYENRFHWAISLQENIPVPGPSHIYPSIIHFPNQLFVVKIASVKYLVQKSFKHAQTTFFSVQDAQILSPPPLTHKHILPPLFPQPAPAISVDALKLHSACSSLFCAYVHRDMTNSNESGAIPSSVRGSKERSMIETREIRGLLQDFLCQIHEERIKLKLNTGYILLRDEGVTD